MNPNEVIIKNKIIDYQNQSIILFDGVCNLCNGAVQFIIKRDKKEIFRFTSLQSETGQAILQYYQLPTQNFDSFLFLENGKLYSQSTAALKVAQKLSSFWKLLYAGMLIPKPFRDFIYAWVAKNRYRWFGKKVNCMIPSPELKKRFLD